MHRVVRKLHPAGGAPLHVGSEQGVDVAIHGVARIGLTAEGLSNPPDRQSPSHTSPNA